MKDRLRHLAATPRFDGIFSGVLRIELLVVLFLYSSVYTQSVFLDSILGNASGLHYVFLVLLLLYVLYRLYTGVTVPRAAVVATIALCLFCLYYSATILWSPADEYAVYKMTRLLTIIPLLFLGTVILSTDHDGKHRLVRIFTYILGLAFLIALVAFYARGFDHKLSDLMGVNYLIYSRVLGAGLIAAVLFTITSDTRRQMIQFGSLAGVVFAAMLLTGGRGPLIAAVAMSAGIIVVQFRQTERSLGWRSAVVGTTFGVLGLVTLVAVIGARTLERFTSLLTLQDGSAATRLDLYWVAIESWSNAPLFGHGIGGYSIVADVGQHPYWPHNIVLEVGVEAGLVGVLLFGVPFGIALLQFGTFETEIDPTSLLAISFTGYMLMNAGLTGDISENRALFVALAMMFVADRSPSVTFSLKRVITRVGSVVSGDRTKRTKIR